MESLEFEYLRKSKIIKEFFGKNERSKEFLQKQKFVCCNKTDKEGRLVNKEGKMTSFAFEKHIAEVFGLDFNQGKYQQAIGGSGHEGKNIKKLHSSSLLAFLFFGGLKENNTLKINGVEYVDSFFEVKCEVFDNPANIDIVLVSEDRKTVLFLESKFAEYLTVGKAYEISNRYESVYNKIDFVGVGLKHSDIFKSKRKKTEGNEVFNLESTDKKQNHYCEGIKQIISHYIGVNKGLANNEKKYYDKLSEIINNADSLILGEIVFDFDDDKKNELEDYKNLYEGIASQLSSEDKNVLEGVKVTKNGKVKVLETLLTYQQVLTENPNYELTKSIKDFYNF